jgi:hypothetical protein
MNDETIDIEALKNDTEFQENVRQLENEMYELNSVARGYQLLDIRLAMQEDEEAINKLFAFIVGRSFDALAEYLTEGKPFDLSQPEEWAIARALYEYAIQHYSEGDTKNSKEVFLVLYHQIADPTVKEAMMVHACAVMAGDDFDTFIDTRVDMSGLDPEDPKSVFLTTFAQPAETLLAQWDTHVQAAKAELKSLEENR